MTDPATDPTEPASSVVGESMVERVKGAIVAAAQAQSHGGYPHVSTEADNGRVILDGAFDVAAFARAAIEEMRYATRAMLDAAWEANAKDIPDADHDYSASCLEDSDYCRFWEAMIDGALSFTPPNSEAAEPKAGGA